MTVVVGHTFTYLIVPSAFTKVEGALKLIHLSVHFTNFHLGYI